MKIQAKTQIGNPIIKNGLRFPNLPGFLLSAITPKMIEKKAAKINCEEIPMETRIESKLIV